MDSNWATTNLNEMHSYRAGLFALLNFLSNINIDIKIVYIVGCISCPT